MKKIISKREEQKSFRICSKKLFLTYLQCRLTLSNVLAQLQDILATYELENYLLVIEDHDNRSVNVEVRIRVFLTCKKLVDISNSAYLNLKGEDKKVYHANYQTCYNDVSVIEYCLQDVVDLATVLVSKNLRLRILEEGLTMPVDQSIRKLAKGSEFTTPYVYSFIKKITSMTKKISNTKTEKRLMLRGKKLFLTYPQCAISLPSVLRQLQDRLEIYGVEDYLIVKTYDNALSVNIGVHIHVFLTCKKAVNIRNPAGLDLKDDYEKVYHGNYQTCPDNEVINLMNYCLDGVEDWSKLLVSKHIRSILV